MGSTEAFFFSGGVRDVVAEIPVSFNAVSGVTAAEMDARTDVAEFSVGGASGTPVFLCRGILLCWWIHLAQCSCLRVIEIGEIRLYKFPKLCRVRCTPFRSEDCTFVISVAVNCGDVDEGARFKRLDGVVSDEVVVERWVVWE